MLFAFRCANAARYPQFLQLQTWEFPTSEKDVARMIKEGQARYNAEGDLEITEFEKPKVTLQGSALEWPDVIGSPPFTGHPLLASERVVAAMKQNVVTGCDFKPVEIRKKTGQKLKMSDAPNYYFVIVRGKISMQVPVYDQTSDVNSELQDKLAGAWDGSDVFGEETKGIGKWALYCSEKVFQLARSEQWTNCGFQPLHYFAAYRKGPYLNYRSQASLPELLDRFLKALTR